MVWGQWAQERAGDLLHQTGCSQRCLGLSGFWQLLELCDVCLASCQLHPGGNLCSGPVAGQLQWPCWLRVSRAVRLGVWVSYPGAEGGERVLA